MKRKTSSAKWAALMSIDETRILKDDAAAFDLVGPLFG